MPTPANDLVSATPSCVNQRLLGTALAGLLCLASAGCSTKAEKPDKADTAGTAGASDMPGSAGAGAAATGGTASENGAAGTSTDGGASSAGGDSSVNPEGGTPPGSGGVNDAAGTSGTNATGGTGGTAGTGGAAAEPPQITSSTAVGVLTGDDFKALCDERAGSVEVMPHCGGFATAKGFSYDTGTQLLSEHTCMGTNTCGGWNCVIAD